MPPCSLCDHPERAAIDAALAGGISQREIARQYTIPKSSLARLVATHAAHQVPTPQPVAPDPDAPLTTAQAQEALTRLQQRHELAVAQLQTAQAALPQALDTYRRALWQEKNVRQALATRDAAQAAVEAAQEQVTLLTQGVAAAKLTLDDVSTYWQQHQQVHYQTVLSYLDDPYERWACATVAHHAWQRHPDGRAAYPGERQRYWQAVEQRFPFVAGAPPLQPNPATSAAETLVWACKSFAYGGQEVCEGEMFSLRGGANDEALLRLNYCRKVRPDDPIVQHQETGRRFRDAAWLEKFLRTAARPEEEVVHG